MLLLSNIVLCVKHFRHLLMLKTLDIHSGLNSKDGQTQTVGEKLCQMSIFSKDKIFQINKHILHMDTSS